MEQAIYNKIVQTIKDRQKKRDYYKITDNILFSKISMARSFIESIHAIRPCLAVIYISEFCEEYKEGFKLGLLFDKGKDDVKL